MKLFAVQWTLTHHPPGAPELSLVQKVDAVAEAGFDGLLAPADPALGELLEAAGLTYWGMLFTPGGEDPAGLIGPVAELGATRATVHLGRHDSELEDDLRELMALVACGEQHGVAVSIETHRDRCTETPEKFAALAAAWRERTGELLPVTFDYSHHAVVKHLRAEEFVPRLVEANRELVQHCGELHLRPFNGHHAQVPVTNPDGSLSVECERYLPVVDATFETWLAGPRRSGELWACPELGPLDVEAYGLSCFPPPWEDACRLAEVLRERWARAASRAE